MRSCTVGIVVPDPDHAKKWAETNGKSTDLQSILKDADFKKVIMDDIVQISAKNKLSGLEKPKDIFLTSDAFSIENNLLTPTFKLKRNVAREHFKEQITHMYDELMKKGF